MIEELREAACRLTDEVAVRQLVIQYLASTSEDEPLERIASVLWRDCEPRDRLLIRALITHELDERRRAGGCGDGLLALCFLLYRVGQPEDVFVIYDVRRANMDCGSMVDHDLLTLGRGRDEMLAFVSDRLSREPSLRERYADLLEEVSAAFDEPNNDAPEGVREFFEHYFAAWSAPSRHPYRD